MADAEDEITAEDLKSFIVSRGGKVKNVELVTHYSYFLKHSSNKDGHKKRFSQLVNELATVKNIEGDRYIVLKKKYRKPGAPLTFIPPSIDNQTTEENRPTVKNDVEPVKENSRTSADVSHDDTRNGTVGNGRTAHRELENGAGVQSEKDDDEVFVSPENGHDRLQGSVEERKEAEGHGVNNGNGRISESVVEPSAESLQQSAPLFHSDRLAPAEVDTRPAEEAQPEEPVSVLDRSSQIESVSNVAETFNEEGIIQELAGPESPRKSKLGSISKVSRTAADPPPLTEEKKASPDSETTEHHEEEEEPPQFGSGEGSDPDHHHDHDMKLGALEKKWMLASAYGRVDELNTLLKQDPTLITKRDFISTLMHWGAKLGKKEMIRMAIEKGVDVNMRTGYTALHIAAMHNREAIMQLLTTDYNANIEVRDYSGRKPHHHLKSTASSYIKSKLDPTHKYEGSPHRPQRQGSFPNPSTPISAKFSRVIRNASVFIKRPTFY